MRLGYNTNGFAHHRIDDVIPILAEIGYESVAITLDHYVLNPYRPDAAGEVARVSELLGTHGLRSVIETGARFLLDSRNKHEPTLLSAERERRSVRVDFLRRAIDVAAVLGSDAVSLWSGAVRDEIGREASFRRLADSLRHVLDHAVDRNVKLAFEPEPGMLVARMADFCELLERIDHSLLGLTLDVGHVHCLDDGPIPDVIEQWRDRLVNVHIEDMCRGRHDHLMFGEGEIDFRPVMGAIERIGYRGGVHVELSRHSHDAVRVAREAYQFLSSHHVPRDESGNARE